MTRDEIEFLLIETKWKTTADPVKDRFCEIMSNRQYGHDALHIAWAFFVCGVNCAVDLIVHADAVTIVEYETQR